MVSALHRARRVGEDSEEKVELWIRAHPVSDCFHDGKGFSKQQSENEKAKATESVIRSLAALEILP